MKQRKWIKVTAYSVVAILIVAVTIGITVSYSMKKSMKAMYEPLPSLEWQQPSILVEEVKATSKAVEPILTEAEDKAANSVINETVHKPEIGEKSHEFISLDEEQLAQLRHPDLSKGNSFSMLLLGVDERAGDKGRSDTLILLAVNPAKERVMALSIPRDTRTQLPVSESFDKINHAYAYGGTSLAIESVERLLGVPIAYFMKTNMEGLMDIVDTLGGVDVSNQRDFTMEGIHFPKGSLHMDGGKALAYIRMRMEDPAGDIGRTARQRQVLLSAADRVISFRTLGRFPKLLSQLSDSVRTNLTLEHMMNLAKDYKSSIKQVDTLYLQGRGATIEGIYYWLPDTADRVRVQKELLALLQSP
ncbi:LCP family protein [Cohnella sp.]|uniref:LCP family glycopolymer transferase n=1 Tax=Cohnella sp. TaxID=1883426 RepID=UPI00356A0477